MSEVSFVNGESEGRIDKVVFADDHILIIDFKTGIPQEKISMDYINQLSFYKNSVQQIYGKNVKTAILWTKSAELVEI